MVMVANPARGQLNRGKFVFPCPRLRRELLGRLYIVCTGTVVVYFCTTPVQRQTGGGLLSTERA